MDQKFFSAPFAVSGDRDDIPQTGGEGLVNYTLGYGVDFSRDQETDPLAKPIKRTGFNGILFDVTNAVGALQRLGYPEWITAADNEGASFPYEIGATVVYRASSGDPWKVYRSKVSPNTFIPTDATKWDDITDPVSLAILSNTSDPDLGAAIIGRAVVVVDAIQDLINAPQRADVAVYCQGYFAGSSNGGGFFLWDAAAARTLHNGGTIISPTVPWSATPATYLSGSGETAPATPGVWRRQFAGECLVDYFGATTAASADAIKKCMEVCIAADMTVGLIGSYLIEKSSAITGFPAMRGLGSKVSSLNANFVGFPFVFTCDAITEEKTWEDFRVTLNTGGGGNVGTSFARIQGNNTLFAWNKFLNIDSRAYESFIEVDKATFVSTFGNESPFAWNRFEGVNVRGGAHSAKHMIKLLQGSGTGNSYLDGKCDLDAADSALIYLDAGAVNAVCGDIVTGGYNTGGTDAAFIKYGPNTTYRSRVLITGNQFDAGMIHPLDQSGTGAVVYTGITFIGNNLGGLVDLYTRTQVMRASQIHDRGVGEWKAGNQASGLGTTGPRNIFTIQLGQTTGTYVTITVDGSVIGVAAGIVIKRWLIRRQTATPVLTSLESVQLPAATAGFFDVTATPAADGTIVFALTWTATGSGTSFDAQITTQGGLLKIKNGQ